jgi:ATP-binding cassette subfamily F protein uup
VRRLERLREEREARRERLGRVRLQLDAGEQSGRLVAELVGVTKSWGEKTVVRDFSTTILRGDRIGLIGPNGAGKTTLLKLILGEIEPDAGLVRHGTRRNVAYFDQMRAQLDPEARLIDVVSPGSDTVEIAGQRRHVVGYLEDFLFSPQRARSPVKTLSGGERNRLLLARLFAQPANLLVLDEPTNDLDLDTLELLEERLLAYPGTLLLVSHDRRFLDNVVTQVIASTGDGRWEECVGGYSDWLRQRGETALAPAATGPTKAPVKTKIAVPEESRSSRPRRLSYRERQELEALPQRIEALEAEQAALAEVLADPSLYSERAQEVAGLKARLTAVEAEIEALLERWSELETLAAGEG